MKRSKEVFAEYWYEQQDEVPYGYDRKNISQQHQTFEASLNLQLAEACLCERCMFFKMHKFAGLSYADRI